MQTTQNTARQTYPGLVTFLPHSATKRGELILQREFGVD